MKNFKKTILNEIEAEEIYLSNLSFKQYSEMKASEARLEGLYNILESYDERYDELVMKRNKPL